VGLKNLQLWRRRKYNIWFINENGGKSSKRNTMICSSWCSFS